MFVRLLLFSGTKENIQSLSQLSKQQIVICVGLFNYLMKKEKKNV